MGLKEVKEFLEQVNQNDISFDAHFYKRSRCRPINEGMIRRFLSESDKLAKVEIGKG